MVALSVVCAVFVFTSVAWLFRYVIVAAPLHPMAYRLDRWTGEVCTVFGSGDVRCPAPAIKAPKSIFDDLEELPAAPSRDAETPK